MKAILLETKDNTNIVRLLKDTISYTTTPNIPGGVYQHIYLIDEDAEIEEGDWVINKLTPNKNPSKVIEVKANGDIITIKGNSRYLFEKITCSKIIASTDSSLGYNNEPIDSIFQPLPLLSEASIKLLIDYYNREGKMPESVDIGYTEVRHCCGAQGFNPMLGDICPACDKELPTIKLNSKGTVDITIPEEKVYSRKEVKSLINKFRDSIIFQDKISYSDMEEWIEKNL